jgi:hypothetical protein
MTMRGFFLLAIFCGRLTAADNPELNGRVVDAQTGQPIARAHLTVHLLQASQQVELTLVSDTDGSFRITNLPLGPCQVFCEKAGYLPANQMMQTAVVADNAKPVPAVIRMTAQAAIEGTVVDDKGMPEENIYLQLVRQAVVNGHRQYQTTQGGNTDETGSFRLFGLPAGRYYIGISARVNGARRAKSLAYPPLFYPNAVDIAAAQPFDLKAGDELQLPIRLPEPVPAHEIRGTVAAAGPNVNVSLTRQPSSLFPFWVNGDTRWDAKTGTFRISGVTPGMYLLTAGTQGGKNWMQASTYVTVSNTDVTGIKLEPRDIAIDGTLRVEGDTSPGSAGQAFAIGGGFSRLGGNAPQMTRVTGMVSFQSERSGYGAQVDADGKFHAAGLVPDTYRVVPQPFGTQCVQSIQQAGRDVREGLAVAEDVPPAPVEIVLTTHCGTVEATVAPADSSQPARNLTVVLLHQAGSELAIEKQGSLGAKMADASSLFLFRGVTPGDYMMYAWPQDAQIEYANPEYMRQFESYGKQITVIADDKVSVTLDRVLPNPDKN